MANDPREYHDKVDFTSEHENWGMRGAFMTHLHSDKEIMLLMPGLAAFALDIRPHFEQGTQIYVVIECRTCIARNIKIWVEWLLKTLTKMGNEIIYKEGEHGYELDASGKILRKWELDDGMC